MDKRLQDNMFTTFTRFTSWPMNMHSSKLHQAVGDAWKLPLDEVRVIITDKKQELEENPQLKSEFKDFAKQFRSIQKTSWYDAYQFAVGSFERLPKELYWRICLELADLSKRRNLIHVAREWFSYVNKLQPFASQGWVDHAKLEEECGELIRCRKIIQEGLKFCPIDEGLLVKSIKLEERIGDLDAARVVLAGIRGTSLDLIWKTVFEGALMESRSGRVDVARILLSHLMDEMPWYGPVFYEAFRLEEKHCNYDNAVQVMELGLSLIPRYGPLWFGAFRLYEKIASSAVDVEKLRALYIKSVSEISKELIWKVYFELAQMEERLRNFDRARKAYVMSVKYCPENLRWKVWMAGSRLELHAGRIVVARALLSRSLKEVPQKTRAMVLLECSRLEEYAGNIEQARSILSRARIETRYEWKVFLESVLLEIRAGDLDAALHAAESALKIHSGTGRLWAILIQLKISQGVDEQFRCFKSALKEVPKSGEVWCEGARLFLDPTSKHFDLVSAKKYLDFAVKFTPQYGDSFVEYLRLEMLLHGPDYIFDGLLQDCVNADPNYGAMWFHCKQSDLHSAIEVLECAYGVVAREVYEFRTLYQKAVVRNCSLANYSAEDLMISECWRRNNMNSLARLYPSSQGNHQSPHALFRSSGTYHD